MKLPHFAHEAVKQLISISMDRTSREREVPAARHWRRLDRRVAVGVAWVQLASFLIATAPSLRSEEEMEKAFQILLQRVEASECSAAR